MPCQPASGLKPRGGAGSRPRSRSVGSVEGAAVRMTAALFVVTAFRLAQRGEYLPYLTDVVTRQGLRPYLAYFAYAGGAFRPDILPLPFWIALTVLGCVGGWGLAMLVLRRFSGQARQFSRLHATPYPRRRAVDQSAGGSLSRPRSPAPRVLGGGAPTQRA